MESKSNWDSGFITHELKVVLTDDESGLTHEEVFRVFDIDDYESLATDAIGLAEWYRDNGETEEDREMFDTAIQLVSFYNLAPSVDRRRHRTVDVQQMGRYESFRELMELSGVRGRNQLGKLLNSPGAKLKETRELFEIAAFHESSIEIPVTPEAYESFRDNLLEEMANIREDLTKQAEAVARDELRTRLNDPSVDEKGRKKASRLLKTDDMFEAFPGLYDAWDKVESMLIREAIKIENDRSAPFEEVVAMADETLAAVAGRVHSDRDVVYQDEAEQVIKKELDTKSAAACLTQAIAISRVHPDALEGEVLELFEQALDSCDPVELWDALTWIRENLVNRNECVRLLLREAEWVLHFLLELALHNRYVTMRAHMTVPERRLFQFLYRRSPSFNGRIPGVDEIGRSFILGIDEQNVETLLEVIGFRGSPKQREELQHRWKSYLHLYPFWCDLMQFDDRESKRRVRETQFTPAIESELVAEVSTVDIPQLPRGLVDASIDSVEQLAVRYCTEIQRKYLVLAFVNQLSQTEIATKFGVSQQAVSKAISSGMGRIRDGLIKDEMIELPEDAKLHPNHPK